MKNRVAIWAGAGFLVAAFWAIYFLVASKDHSTEQIVSTLAPLTCPIAMAHYPVSVGLSIVANVATYALVGLVVETLRRQFSHSK